MQGDKVIAYASRALTDTEQRYAQIEKEMLSIVFSCENFHSYIFGKQVTVYNDHKPLEQFFAKPLLAAPMRIQKMMLRLQWYDIEVKYRKGKEMHVSDALSRGFPNITENHADASEMIQLISVSSEKYSEIKQATQNELCKLHDIIIKGWPDTRSEMPFEVRPYWPGMNGVIDSLVSNCSVRAEHQNMQPAEPLKPTPTPDLPYDMVGCDIFQFESEKYVVIVDYYSKYIDVKRLESETTTGIKSALLKVFSFHGIPRTIRSNNGPQFSSVSSKVSVRSTESFIKLQARISKAQMEKRKEPYKQLNACGVNQETKVLHCWTTGQHLRKELIYLRHKFS